MELFSGGKRWEVFEEGIEVDEEFAHGGGEGDFEGFSFGGEAQVEGFEDGIFRGGHQSGHVEAASGFGAAATDHAFAFEGAAIAIAWSQAGEGGDLLTGEGAELGDGGEEADGGEFADSIDLAQAGDFTLEEWIGGEEFFDLRLDVGLLCFQETQQLFDRGEDGRLVGLLETVFLGSNQLDELIAPRDGGFELQLGLAEGIARSRLKTLAVVGEEGGINLVGLGEESLRFGVVANLARVDDAHADAFALESQHQLAVVGAGGLADDPKGLALELMDPFDQ